MEQIFRRGKPPLKLLEKGDLQRIARQKMLKAAPRCPLCKEPILFDDMHEIVFNGKPTVVHKTCPGIKNIRR